MLTFYSFGASTAAGSRDSEGGFIKRLDWYLRDNQIGEAYNHGVGGDTTEMMVERLPALMKTMDSYENPFALVTLGINDVPRIQDDNPDKRVPLQNHLESLSVILEETKRIGEVIYLTQYPVDYISLSIDSDLLSKYRVSAKEKVQSAGVKVIDIFGMVTNGYV